MKLGDCVECNVLVLYGCNVALTHTDKKREIKHCLPVISLSGVLTEEEEHTGLPWKLESKKQVDFHSSAERYIYSSLGDRFIHKYGSKLKTVQPHTHLCVIFHSSSGFGI